MGRGGTDTNRFDFFNDGSGQGQLLLGNLSSTFFRASDASHSKAFLYPTCPAPASAGTGTDQGDGYAGFTGQVGELAGYVTAAPPCSQAGQLGNALAPGVQGHHPDRHQELRELLLMSRRRGLLALVALVAVAAGVMALGGVGAARSTKPKVVKLYDNYYSPVSVKISKRGKVKWKWTRTSTRTM